MHKVKEAIMTVDVEDYFQVAAFDNVIDVKNWDNYPLRATDVTRRLAAHFTEKGIRATFFLLGWVAEKDPGLVPALVEMGHEIASHGYWHQKADRQDPATFFQDVDAAKKCLEDQAGHAVIGYRAPSFSMGKHTPAHFSQLVKAGYHYSSSTYPISHDHYGDPTLPTHPHAIDTEDGTLMEFPQSTIMLGRRRLPIGGGGYFRLCPWSIYKKGIQTYWEQAESPYIFYFHPWECDPEQPRIANASLKSRFRHYINLSRMESKIHQLTALPDVTWISMQDAWMARNKGKSS